MNFLEDDPTDFKDGNITLSLPVQPGADGEIHAVVSWFDAALDGDGDITLSTSPWASDNSFARQQHWGQLVQILDLEDASPPSLPAKPREVGPGDTIRLTTTIAAKNAGGSFYFDLDVVPSSAR